MLNALQNWKGAITVNGTNYTNIQEFLKNTACNQFSGDIHIILHSNKKNAVQGEIQANKQYKITVKSYMTKKSSPEFDFMAKWNNDIPMPLVTMTGEKLKETKGMVYMKLHGVAEATVTCMCCGKQLTNPISQYYGIGPICMGKVGIQADIEDVDTITKKLIDVQWTGWIIKSAIIKEEEL